LKRKTILIWKSMMMIRGSKLALLKNAIKGRIL